MRMKNLLSEFGVAVLALGLAANGAFANSSGSFSASIATSACTINNTTGALNNNTITSLTAALQIPNGSGTAILIRPSFVTGLFTDTQLSKNTSGNITLSSATAAVTVGVEDCAAGKPFGDPSCYRVAPDTGEGVIYDERFQQISSGVFNLISACSTTSDNPDCFFDLILSTLAAHSMDFVDNGPTGAGLISGTRQLNINVAMTCFVNSNSGTATEVPCTSAFTANTAGACDGPGVLTVEQVKNFSTNSPICISSTGSCP